MSKGKEPAATPLRWSLHAETKETEDVKKAPEILGYSFVSKVILAGWRPSEAVLKKMDHYAKSKGYEPEELHGIIEKKEDACRVLVGESGGFQHYSSKMKPFLAIAPGIKKSVVFSSDIDGISIAIYTNVPEEITLEFIIEAAEYAGLDVVKADLSTNYDNGWTSSSGEASRANSPMALEFSSLSGGKVAHLSKK